VNAQAGSQWVADTELDNFEQNRLTVAYQDRAFSATLVRPSNNPIKAQRAVLYIHGLTDYFFQAHLADAYRAKGYAFYAIDLHAYGRSLRPDQRPNYCDHVAEYYPELDAAIAQLKSDGAEQIVINAHSTGGLIAALYLHEGRYREAVNALYLNSPFFEFPLQRWQQVALRALVALGRWFPHIAYHRAMPSLYAKSILRDFHGQWSYNLALKPAQGFAITTGWMRAIYQAQRRLQKGLAIHCPILLMHAARSQRAHRWSDEVLTTDIVLNIEHMRRYGPTLGKQVTLVAINDAMHDLALSSDAVRAEVFATTFSWLEQVLPPLEPLQKRQLADQQSR